MYIFEYNSSCRHELFLFTTPPSISIRAVIRSTESGTKLHRHCRTGRNRVKNTHIVPPKNYQATLKKIYQTILCGKLQHGGNGGVFKGHILT